jgi:hypothetical protein
MAGNAACRPLAVTPTDIEKFSTFQWGARERRRKTGISGPRVMVMKTVP